MLDERSFAAAAADLVGRDAALRAIVERHGLPDFWAREPGLETLVLLILEQQVSLASARAAYERLVGRLGALTPAGILGSTDEELRRDGFSRQKARYVRALATALEDGSLDLAAVALLADDEVRRALVALPGIGPWTAEVYLMFCAGHPDVFPSADVALQASLAKAFGLQQRPSARAVTVVAEAWKPWRSVAARLFWAYYAATLRREVMPTSP